MQPDGTRPSNKQKINIPLDLRVVVVVLLLTIIGMLALWKPWFAGENSASRTVEVAGEAKVKAAPDEFVFYPAYQFDNEDRTAALAELTKKSDSIVSGLKEIGVPEKQIKTNSNGYDTPGLPEKRVEAVATYSLQLTVTTQDKQLAQKIQEYLLTTAPSGGVSPQYTFSEKKRKALENQAREEATKDARRKAEQMAANLGFRIGGVKSVSDNKEYGVFPMEGRAMALDTGETAQPQLSLQPGENELNHSVTVTYFIR